MKKREKLPFIALFFHYSNVVASALLGSHIHDHKNTSQQREKNSITFFMETHWMVYSTTKAVNILWTFAAAAYLLISFTQFISGRFSSKDFLCSFDCLPFSLTLLQNLFHCLDWCDSKQSTVIIVNRLRFTSWKTFRVGKLQRMSRKKNLFHWNRASSRCP